MIKAGTSIAKLVCLFARKSSALAVFLSVIGQPGFAGDKLVNIQGKLTNSSYAVLHGTYTLSFRLYTNSTAPVTSAMWTESKSVFVSTGLFQATLGTSSSLNAVPFNKPYYLGIQVAGDANEMAPRQMLGASGYALGSLGNFDVQGNVAATGSVSASSMTVGGKDVGGNLLPSGALLPFAGLNVPKGFLLCDGSALSRITYADLFSAIGTSWGAGDGSTTFNVPDLRGRVPVGTGQGPGLTDRVLAQKLGEEAHLLTIAEMPPHNHTQASHNHAVVPAGGGNFTGFSGTATNAGPIASVSGGPGRSGNFTSDSQTPVINNTGAGVAHNLMQPSTVLNFIIKY